MFDIFLDKFKVTSHESVENNNELYNDIPGQLYELLDLHGGKSFNNGLYRVHSFASSIHWSLIIGQYFVKYQSRVYPFGFDWMGRQFCLSNSGTTILYMLDPATGEDFELQQELNMLHDDDFVNDTTNMLADDIFRDLLKRFRLNSIEFSQCLGYRIPLFMGGKDTLDNYEKSDLEVYWELQKQFYVKTRDLPDGTNIKSIKIK